MTTILRDLDNLKPESALKVPLAELAESKAKVRSALNRERREKRAGKLPRRPTAIFCMSGMSAISNELRFLDFGPDAAAGTTQLEGEDFL
jgi:hypothetical protein